MTSPTSNIAFIPSVKAAQEVRGSRSAYAKVEERDSWNSVVTPMLEDFIAERYSFYLGTTNADGQPYIQHRGGPKGFLRVLDQHTLAMADYADNTQYISLGNLAENDKAFIFLIDYPNRQRIKIWGTARFVEDDPTLLQQAADIDYKARPQRVLLFDVKAWDVNCPQHIRQRFTVEEMEPVAQKLQDRIADLERENAELTLQLRGRTNGATVSKPSITAHDREPLATLEER